MIQVNVMQAGTTCALSSNIYSQLVDPKDGAAAKRIAQNYTDALESLLLALHSNGVNIKDARVQSALETTLEKLSQ